MLNICLGSTAGGLNLNISGQGFSASSSVKICDKECKIIQADYAKIICLVSL